MNKDAKIAFDLWVNRQHPNGKSLADVFEPAFGMIAENAWGDAWDAAIAANVAMQALGEPSMPVIGAYAKPLVRKADAEAALAAKDAEIAGMWTKEQVQCMTASAIEACEITHGQEIAALTAERDALRKDAGRLGWEPIESEPKDMESRLFRVNGFCVQGFIDATGALCAQNDRQPWRKMHGKPTHWMPLPPPPAMAKEQK